MLCRNKVLDFDRWKRVFDSHADAHRTARLTLLKLWREQDDPNNVYFLFEAADVEKARAFLTSPGAPESRAVSGVIDGPEIHFLSEVPRYR